MCASNLHAWGIVAIASAAPLSFALASEKDNEKKNEADKGWEVTVMAGTVLTPTYLGDDEYQVVAFPNVRVTYSDRFFASLGEGIGYNVINGNGWRIGPLVKYNFGRDEDGSNPLSLSGDDTKDLIGLGDVDPTAEIGGFVEYEHGPFKGKVELRFGAGGHEGFIGEAEVKYSGMHYIGQLPIIYSLGPKIVFGDDKYNSAFFDVNAQQSAASGLSQFDAGAGLISFGIHGSLAVPLSDKMAIVGFAGYDQLTGDVGDSSLVRERGSKDQGSVGILMSYKF